MSKPEPENLDFERLLVEAILEWPSPVRVSVKYLPQGGYLVEGLGELSESIAERRLEGPMAVLFSNLHDAIFERLHAVAPEHEELIPAGLARSGVKSAFERRLSRARRKAGLGWTRADHALIDRYFAQNALRDAA